MRSIYEFTSPPYWCPLAKPDPYAAMMTFGGLVTSAPGLPLLTYSRTIPDDQNQL